MSSVAINPPKTPVTEGSSGIAAATLPNMWRDAGAPGPRRAPLPNIGKSGMSPSGYSTSVKIEGKAVRRIQGASFKSMGDIARRGSAADWSA